MSRRQNVSPNMTSQTSEQLLLHTGTPCSTVSSVHYSKASTRSTVQYQVPVRSLCIVPAPQACRSSFRLTTCMLLLCSFDRWSWFCICLAMYR